MSDPATELRELMGRESAKTRLRRLAVSLLISSSCASPQRPPLFSYPPPSPPFPAFNLSNLLYYLLSSPPRLLSQANPSPTRRQLSIPSARTPPSRHAEPPNSPPSPSQTTAYRPSPRRAHMSTSSQSYGHTPTHRSATVATSTCAMASRCLTGTRVLERGEAEEPSLGLRSVGECE